MPKSRAERRGLSGNSFLLFAAETTLGWRVIRHVSGAQGEEMMARGAWRDVYNEMGQHIGYQMIANARGDMELPSRPCSVVISVREMSLIAGQAFRRGRSHTARLPEERRITRRTRYGVALPAEDDVERAVAKLAEWPRMHGDRAVRVYPKKNDAG